MPANKPKTQQTDQGRRQIDIEDEETRKRQPGQSVGQLDQDKENRGGQKSQTEKEPQRTGR